MPFVMLDGRPLGIACLDLLEPSIGRLCHRWGLAGRDVGALAHADPDRVVVGLSILFALERLLDTDAPPSV